jgi:hypothetical protein
MTSIRNTLLGMVVAAAFLPAGVAAQGTAEQRAACMGDAFEFCGAEIPDATKVEAGLGTRQAAANPRRSPHAGPAHGLLVRPTSPPYSLRLVR